METKEKTIIQKIGLKEKEDLLLAQRYYKLLSAMSNSGLTDREIQLMAFTAVKGNISYSTNREDFCKMYNSTSPTINNIISKLKKLGLLVKDGSKVKVHPTYLLDFNKDLTLVIQLQHG